MSTPPQRSDAEEALLPWTPRSACCRWAAVSVITKSGLWSLKLAPEAEAGRCPVGPVPPARKSFLGSFPCRAGGEDFRAVHGYRVHPWRLWSVPGATQARVSTSRRGEWICPSQESAGRRWGAGEAAADSRKAGRGASPGEPHLTPELCTPLAMRNSLPHRRLLKTKPGPSSHCSLAPSGPGQMTTARSHHLMSPRLEGSHAGPG